MRVLGLFSIVILNLVVSSCSETTIQTQSEQKFLPDSMASTSVLAAFRKGQDLNVFLVKESDTLHYQFFKNGLVLTDTLCCLGTDTFYSFRYKATYILFPDLIKCLHEQKIIHPSSNWQGQAPWSELNHSEFERMVEQDKRKR